MTAGSGVREAPTRAVPFSTGPHPSKKSPYVRRPLRSIPAAPLSCPARAPTALVPLSLGIMDLSGGPLGCDALAPKLRAPPARIGDPPGAEIPPKNDSFLVVRQETEAQGPGDSGSRTHSVEGQERARTQTSGFSVLGCGSCVPVHLCTPLDPQSKETFPPQPLRPADLAPSAGKLRDDG